MLTTMPRLVMSNREFERVEAMCHALRKRCAAVSCITCGRAVPLVFDVRREHEPRFEGKRLGEACCDGIRVVAVRHERFCSLRCDLLFVQRRLREDGPDARIAVGLFRSAVDGFPKHR